MVKVNNEHLQSTVNNFGSKSSHFLNELLKLKVFLYLKKLQFSHLSTLVKKIKCLERANDNNNFTLLEDVCC